MIMEAALPFEETTTMDYGNFSDEHETEYGNFSDEYKTDYGNFSDEYKTDYGNFSDEYETDYGNFSNEYETDYGNFLDEYEANLWKGEVGTLITASSLLVIIMGPVLLVGGLTCNTLSLVVLQKKKFNLHFSIYLSAIAVCDNLHLLFHLVPWVLYSGAGVNVPVIISCNVVYILHFFPGYMSSFLLVALTFDRFLSVYFPMRRVGFSAPKFVIPFLFLLVMLVNWHTLGGLKEKTEQSMFEFQCEGRNAAVEKYHMFHAMILDCVIYSYGPSCLIICINSLILVKCYYYRRFRVVSATPETLQSLAAEHRRRREDRVTRAALTVTSVFVLLTTPACIVFMAEPAESRGPLVWATWHLILQVTTVIGQLNHSVNILVYCITGPAFRAEFCRLFACCKNPNPGQPNQVFVIPGAVAQP